MQTGSTATSQKLVNPQNRQRSGDLRLHFGLGCCIVLVVAMEAVALFAAYGVRQPFGDGGDYNEIAVHLAHGEGVALTERTPAGSVYGLTAYRLPGYPAFLALIYRLFGNRLLAVYLLQLAMFGASAWLLLQISLEYLPFDTSALASVLFLVYAPFLGFPTSLLIETPVLFLTVTFAYGLVRFLKRPENLLWNALWLGVFTGIAATLRAIFAPMAAVPGLALLLGFRDVPLRRRLLAAALLSVAWLATLGPWMYRNIELSGAFIPLGVANGAGLHMGVRQYSGRMTYQIVAAEWHSMNEDFDGSLGEGFRATRGTPAAGRAPLIAAEVWRDRHWKEIAVEEWHSLPLPVVLRSIPKRLLAFWGVDDTLPDSPLVHHLVQTQYIIFGVLGLIGVWSLRRRLLRLWPLWWMALYLTGMHLVYLEDARYSLPARTTLIVFVAAGLTTVWIRGRSWVSFRRAGASHQA